MLRNFVIIGAGLFALCALVVAVNTPGGWPMLLVALVLLAGTIFERVHYRGSEGRGGVGHWQPTSERFLDEASGRPVIVWFNNVTGERRYIEQGEAPPH
jgi:hypothetical protein